MRANASQKTQQTACYEGLEHDQTFVPRFTKNQHFSERDRRQQVDSPAWKWLCDRHRRHWLTVGDGRRAAPQNHHYDGVVGWWFPSAWVEDFAALGHADRGPVSPVATRRPPYQPADTGGSHPKRDEIRSWDLPPGSIISAVDATVTYPDGSRVTWGDMRRAGR